MLRAVQIYPPPRSLCWGAWGWWPGLSVVLRWDTGLKQLFHRCHNKVIIEILSGFVIVSCLCCGSDFGYSLLYLLGVVRKRTLYASLALTLPSSHHCSG